jgi:hypothetical protein
MSEMHASLACSDVSFSKNRTKPIPRNMPAFSASGAHSTGRNLPNRKDFGAVPGGG